MSPFDRNAMRRALDDEAPWDVIVVGGGATGLGCAVDAAARGYRTLLLEAHDFAKGTSSRSTKLIHGGVRYLQQGNVRLVMDALRERERLRRNAPHLVHTRPFVVPAYRWGARLYYGLGLKLYDALALRDGFAPSRLLGRAATLDALPTLAPDGLRGGARYHDGQFDDAALALALARTAAHHGAVLLNYAPVTALRLADGRVAGVTARDAETGATYTLSARVVVNAAGPWSDAVRRLDAPHAPPQLALSQGVHLVFDARFLPGPTALLVPRTDDGRVLFAIPWEGVVLVGTTDTPVGRAALEPRPLAEEVAFLLRHAAHYLRPAPTAADVRAVFTGLRPLVDAGGTGSTAALSRDHVLQVSPTGLVTITGGKWTTYRLMAEQAVSRAARVGGLPPRPCPTATLRLLGAPEEAPTGPFAAYGTDAPALQRLLAEGPAYAEPLHARHAYRTGEVVWAARHTMARTVEDVLARRLRLLVQDAAAAVEAAPRVAALLADALGRDAAWQADQVRRFEALATAYRLPDALSPQAPFPA